MTTLKAHLEAINAEKLAWVAEDPENRAAPMIDVERELEDFEACGYPLTVEEWEFQQDLQIYSDMHKDAYGFRPRYSIREMTKEEIRADLESFGEMIREQEDERREQEARALVLFEERIEGLIEIGAADRETAIRWIAEAEEVHNDAGYLCYKLGLPYQMEKEIQPLIKAA